MDTDSTLDVSGRFGGVVQRVLAALGTVRGIAMFSAADSIIARLDDGGARSIRQGRLEAERARAAMAVTDESERAIAQAAAVLD